LWIWLQDSEVVLCTGAKNGLGIGDQEQANNRKGGLTA
jgi:hypothetical protein